MKAIKVILITFIIITVFHNLTEAQQSYNFNEGLKAAKSQNKLIVINIHSENDRWCAKMDKEVYGDAGVQKDLASFIYIRLNSASGDTYIYNDKEMTAADLTRMLGVMSYPTHVFMNPNGSVISFMYNGVESTSIPGFVDAEDFISILNYFRDGKYTSVDLSTIL